MKLQRTFDVLMTSIGTASDARAWTVGEGEGEWGGRSVQGTGASSDYYDGESDRKSQRPQSADQEGRDALVSTHQEM